MPWKEILPDWAVKEVEELRAAPVGVVLVFLVGVGVGVWGVGAWYYSGRLADLEARVSLRDDELGKLRQTPSPEVGAGEAPSSDGDPLPAWGGGLPNTCNAELDRGALAAHASKYEAVVACGFALKNVDRYADTAITLSGKYALTETGVIVLETASSEPMKQALREFVVGHARNATAEKRSTLRFNVSVWYQVALLPKEVLVSDIHSLADIKRLGGRVLDKSHRSVVVQGYAPPREWLK
jgi:hypothetical protein